MFRSISAPVPPYSLGMSAYLGRPSSLKTCNTKGTSMGCHCSALQHVIYGLLKRWTYGQVARPCLEQCLLQPELANLAWHVRAAARLASAVIGSQLPKQKIALSIESKTPHSIPCTVQFLSVS